MRCGFCAAPLFMCLTVFLFQNFRVAFSVVVRFKCMRKLFSFAFLIVLFARNSGGEIAGAEQGSRQNGSFAKRFRVLSSFCTETVSVLS